VTRGTQPGSERFVIAAEARPRPQPEAVPVTQAQGAAAVYAPPYAPPQADPAAVSAAAAAASAATAAPATTSPDPAKLDLIFKPRGKVLTPEEMARAQGK
jgi:hypothetical protein